MAEFEDIYQEYFKTVYLYIKGLCGSESIAEEVTSDTFFKAMKALDGFKGECDIRVWLCQIAKNTYYSYMRKNGRLVDINSAEPCTTYHTLDEMLMDKEDSLKIHSILHKMEEPYKEVFTLRVFSELSFLQIGALFKRSQNWACVTYHRARKKIIDEMEEDNDG